MTLVNTIDKEHYDTGIIITLRNTIELQYIIAATVERWKYIMAPTFY